MDDAVRIPIDIGYEAASAEAASGEPAVQRTTVREDGTVVIDVLAPQPCVPEPSTGDEIVVCAQIDGDPQRMPDAQPPPSPGPMEKLKKALTAHVGPVEITPFGARFKF
ncbi:hypothetical protein [Altererythrobacter sp. Root672]|uniref:hypothetical protein n=1 Tax=Altererythrobacter sp. Root672 TaxID=1736584 RepID=UPI0006F714E9|nr:hypothetical protein [Altererythrobacter sp. Root672]KRA81200.1 hypothetical protein ASD76_11490 [Altererythrobacter sp. Root672]